MCYTSGDTTDGAEEVSGILGKEEYGYMEISKKEFERETGEGDI